MPTVGNGLRIQQGITIGVAQTARIDVIMELGAATESVTVNADALCQDGKRRAELQHRTERINELPLNFGARGPGSFRNPFTFVR